MSMTVPNSNAMVMQRDTRLAVQPQSVSEMREIAKIAFACGIGGVKSPEEAFMRILFGQERGFTAAQSLELVFIVNGKPGVEAKTIVGRCLQYSECEYFEPVEVTAVRSTWKTKRKGRDEQKVTWTIEMAQRAKLTEKDIWKQYPENMLQWKAAMNLARQVYPEIVTGLHVPDELRDGAVMMVHGDQLVTTEVLQPGQQPAAALTPAPAYQTIVSALLERIKTANTADEKKAIRADFTAKRTSGELPPMYADEVMDAYNKRFPTKPKGEPVSTTPTQSADATGQTPPAADSGPTATTEAAAVA